MAIVWAHTAHGSTAPEHTSVVADMLDQAYIQNKNACGTVCCYYVAIDHNAKQRHQAR